MSLTTSRILVGRSGPRCVYLASAYISVVVQFDSCSCLLPRISVSQELTTASHQLTRDRIR